MADISDHISLPPGWDTKYDFKTGKRYYINYFTRHTSMEDPRIRYQRLQAGEPLTIQMYHSSPSRSLTPQPLYHIHQDVNLSSGRPSPIGRSYSPLMGSSAIHYHAHKPHEFPTLDISVTKIKALFPTVDETHIKALLHKYHYREAVVMSALQVEKHPLATPGPYSSPLAVAKHIVASASSSPSKLIPFSLRSLSPKFIRSSPKMKLRYLKSVFPVVEETMLLDTLSSSENNVHKATETLVTMGFNKKDLFLPKYSFKKSDTIDGTYKTDFSYSNTTSDSILIPLHGPPSGPKSSEEKLNIKRKLEDKFEKVAERIVSLALETTDYDEERAEHLLETSISQEKKLSCTDSSTNHVPSSEDLCTKDKVKEESQSSNKLHSDAIEEESKAKGQSKDYTSPQVPEQTGFKYPFVQPLSKIFSWDTVKGLNHFSLSNFSMNKKTNLKMQPTKRVFPKGARKSLLGPRYIPKGPNIENWKGPCKVLAKGSIYSNSVPK